MSTTTASSPVNLASRSHSPTPTNKKVKLIPSSPSAASAGQHELPNGMEWRITPLQVKYIEVENSNDEHKPLRSTTNRFWERKHVECLTAYSNYVCTTRTSHVSQLPFPANCFVLSRTTNGKGLAEVLNNYSKSWHEMLAFHIRTQHAIQDNGLIYPCFLDWFGRRMIEKVYVCCCFLFPTQNLKN